MKTWALLAVSAIVLAAPALAQGNSNKNKHQPSAPIVVELPSLFGSSAERDIRAYFQSHPMTPQSLPPGIAKNLTKGKALPPGIAKRALPGDLVRQIPSWPGHEVIIVDRDVMLVNIATQVIVDILTRVL